MNKLDRLIELLERIDARLQNIEAEIIYERPRMQVDTELVTLDWQGIRDGRQEIDGICVKRAAVD